MDPVPQLMGQGGHVPRVAGVIEQHVRGVAGHHPHAEGAAGLARLGQGVDAPLGEEAPGRIGHRRGEPAKGIEDQSPGFVEGDLPAFAPQRSVDVGIFHLLQAEQLALEFEIFLGQPIIILGDLHHPLNHGRLGLAGQMSRRHDVGIAAQLDLAGVVEQNVVEAGGEHQGVLGVLSEKGGKGLLAGLAVGMVEQGEEFLAGHLAGLRLPGQLKPVAKGRGLLLEQLDERLLAREILALEHLLDLFAEGIGGMGPQLVQVVAEAGHFGVLEQLDETHVVDFENFQFEKQHLFGGRTPDLPGPGQQRLVAIWGAVRREQQLGVEVGLEAKLLQVFVALQGSDQKLGRERVGGNAPAEIVAEPLGLIFRLFQISPPLRIVRSTVKRRQIPAETLIGVGHEYSLGRVG